MSVGEVGIKGVGVLLTGDVLSHLLKEKVELVKIYLIF